ncbi:hypothetical protein VQ03_27450 [Methylobacterium tarhaniae]|uniref:Nucleotide modification associated domain-containing protein n=1 Tax=Methylobacterium tarhaniae TaxID=1187852 RepID=A0A0J6S7Q9_9HYPH|nr:hypothetical protein [Methylobacterium tarhaniae]KMO31260.1 hypothetical protein VQ03_27450 [Methylobacterium tarhaniae]
MAKVYIYVVARDFGFAPNPFHGVCTLATCKPDIRRVAREGDWVVGMGGIALNAVGRCVFAMQVTTSLTFEEYWTDPEYRRKRPVRNGSLRAMVGDNIYHRDDDGGWIQEDSHHSRPDGTPDPQNMKTDTSGKRVLLSRRFLYFGREAPLVPAEFLAEAGYRNIRRHRTFELEQCAGLIGWLTRQFAADFNQVLADPCQFDEGSARYSGERGRILR